MILSLQEKSLDYPPANQFQVSPPHLLLGFT